MGVKKTLEYKSLLNKLEDFSVSIPSEILKTGDLTLLSQLLDKEIEEWLQKNGINSEDIKAKLIRQCWPIIESNTNIKYGQIINSDGLSLVSDLKPPITIGSIVKYQIISKTTYKYFLWTIVNKDTDIYVYKAEIQKNFIKTIYDVPGEYEIVVECKSKDGNMVERIKMCQKVTEEDRFVTDAIKYMKGKSKADDYIDAYRELANDFRLFIIAAAKSTGPYGVTPRFLAAVIFWEIRNNPKLNRNNEIEVATLLLGQSEWLNPKYQNLSVGVGQIRLSTAAMVSGELDLMDHSKKRLEQERMQINSEFGKLDRDTKEVLLAQLEWPKSNIKYVAEYLTKLKNRPHRYPNLNRIVFSSQESPVSIIATEYNMGPTNTPVHSAGISEYGHGVWTIMQDPIISNIFKNE